VKILSKLGVQRTVWWLPYERKALAAVQMPFLVAKEWGNFGGQRGQKSAKKALSLVKVSQHLRYNTSNGESFTVAGKKDVKSGVKRVVKRCQKGDRFGEGPLRTLGCNAGKVGSFTRGGQKGGRKWGQRGGQKVGQTKVKK